MPWELGSPRLSDEQGAGGCRSTSQGKDSSLGQGAWGHRAHSYPCPPWGTGDATPHPPPGWEGGSQAEHPKGSPQAHLTCLILPRAMKHRQQAGRGWPWMLPGSVVAMGIPARAQQEHEPQPYRWHVCWWGNLPGPNKDSSSAAQVGPGAAMCCLHPASPWCLTQV